MNARLILWTGSTGLWLLLAAGAAADDAPGKWFEVRGTVNTEPGYLLRVSVDRPDCVYHEGDAMTIRVMSERDCYLYLLYYSGDKVGCLFPNKFHPDNFVAARQEVLVPQPGSNFTIVCQPPFGVEVLHAVATLQPVEFFAEKDFTVQPITPVGQQDLRQMVSTVQKQRPEAWAEARVQITTLPRTSVAQTKKSRRHAVCVGISSYQSQRIQPLQVSHRDAERFAQMLQQSGGVAAPILLTNEQATKAAIEQAIFRDLVAHSSPGDTVFIYFSCHGGRTSDTNGDEQDGFDEYLVPHEGELGQPETMILDDTFARWVQELDGREVAILLDNCYSGGSSKSIKGLAGGLAAAARGQVDFFDGELRRTKDLGQANTMVIAACQADQLAWEMSAPGEQSVLTHFLLSSLAEPAADANGDGALTLGEAFQFARLPVEQYVRETFNAAQNPVLIDNAQGRIVLRP